jgi:hypothetical protein
MPGKRVTSPAVSLLCLKVNSFLHAQFCKQLWNLSFTYTLPIARNTNKLEEAVARRLVTTVFATIWALACARSLVAVGCVHPSPVDVPVFQTLACSATGAKRGIHMVDEWTLRQNQEIDQPNNTVAILASVDGYKTLLYSA